MYKVYYTDDSGTPRATDALTELTVALNFSEKFRKAGFTFVTMVSENPNSVGKSGVDEIKEGVLPCGNEYGWKKRRI